MRELFSREKWRYLFYTISHPMDGFYWIRHQERGSVALAVFLVILFSACFTANRLLASFVVSDIDERTVNSAYELLTVLILYILLCVSNWSVTCLMNGEGRLKDIAIAIGYGTFPISVVFVIATIVSQFVADDEQAFYTLILAVGIAYGLILILIGIMQVHNYTMGKTLVTLLLTLAAFLVIVFLILLMTNLMGMVYNFFHSIYTELIFRV
ncbi:MAG: YIP1 family protein [Lachnospiraceae bacterium]|nr:YIP1 family protein [Lachnospiraceae bacterium]MCR5476447.1 YIP1 family protein [Lachnospiraceae bacterium]